MSFGGKSQHVEQGTEIKLTKEQAERMGSKVKPFVTPKKLDASK